MDLDLALERIALQFCRQALDHHVRGPADNLSTLAVGWMLPDLARLLAAHHDRPTIEVADAVRRFIDERTFMEDAGDPVVDEQIDAQAQALLDLALRVHRAMQHRADPHTRTTPIWPVTPLMCG